jgi:hypothetical protein
MKQSIGVSTGCSNRSWGFVDFQGCVVSTSIVLVCAVLASLAAGVLLAYGVCQAMFALFHSHAKQIAEKPTVVNAISTPIIEG